MTRYKFDWVDAFTTRAFGGNPLIVVHGANGLEIASRLALVSGQGYVLMRGELGLPAPA